MCAPSAASEAKIRGVLEASGLLAQRAAAHAD
jgi:hypothetical protein